VSVRNHIESDESFVLQRRPTRFELPPMWTTAPRGEFLLVRLTLYNDLPVESKSVKNYGRLVEALGLCRFLHAAKENDDPASRRPVPVILNSLFLCKQFPVFLRAIPCFIEIGNFVVSC
jgi:hypothetical protein